MHSRWPIECFGSTPVPIPYKTMQSDGVTQLVADTFVAIGADETEPITRTILLQDRYFVGYQFFCGKMLAVWFVDGGIIKFHSASGGLLRKIDLAAEQVKKAA